MSFKCKLGFHSWNGCKCIECGKERDQYHDWSEDCEKCSRCGKIRMGNYHDWWIDCEKCAKCGKSRENHHNWSKDCEKCSKCRVTRKNQHDWSEDCEKCSKCDEYKVDDNPNCRCHQCTDPLKKIETFFRNCTNGRTKKVESFLNSPFVKKNDLNKVNSNGDTALFLSAKNRHIEIVKLLLDKGVDVNIENNDGDTVLEKILCYATIDLEIVKLLVPQTNDFTLDKVKNRPTIIYNATESGDFETLKWLLQNRFKDINAISGDGYFPLIIPMFKNITIKNKLQTIELLLDYGAKIDLQNQLGASALIIASGRGYKEIVELLLKKGANPNLRTKSGITAYSNADNDEIRELLNSVHRSV